MCMCRYRYINYNQWSCGAVKSRWTFTTAPHSSNDLARTAITSNSLTSSGRPVGQFDLTCCVSSTTDHRRLLYSDELRRLQWFSALYFGRFFLLDVGSVARNRLAVTIPADIGSSSRPIPHDDRGWSAALTCRVFCYQLGKIAFPVTVLLLCI